MLRFAYADTPIRLQQQRMAVLVEFIAGVAFIALIQNIRPTLRDVKSSGISEVILEDRDVKPRLE